MFPRGKKMTSGYARSDSENKIINKTKIVPKKKVEIPCNHHVKKHKDLFNYEWILELNDFSRKYLTSSSDIQDGFVAFAFFSLGQ